MTRTLLSLVLKALQKITCIGLLLWPLPAFSLVVDGLYDAAIQVEDQSPEQMLRAKKMGLAQVLVKVTGQTQSLTHPKVRAALRNPESYLQRFSFGTELLKNGQPQAVIELAFDSLQVDQLIRESGHSIWGKDRAAVLVWLVEDTQGIRQIVNDNRHPMVAQIMSQAKLRGIPLLWPLLDLEDQLSINAGDLWGVFRDTITRASSRYQADAVLVGLMFQDSQKLWRVDWNFWLDDVEQKWSSQGTDIAVLVEPLEDRLAASLVEKFALDSGAESLNDEARKSAILRIDQVTQVGDYVEIQAMLQTIAGIQKVQLHSAKGTTLEFRVFAQSNLAQVKSVIDLKRRLQAVEGTDIVALDQSLDLGNNLVWHYQWN